MLIKTIATSDFNKKIKTMIVSGIILMILGISALALALTLTTTESFIDGFYSGTGSGLVAGGLVMVIYYGFALKNPARRKKVEIQDKDERNRFITLKASSIALMVIGGLQYVALLIAGTLNLTVFFTLLAVLAAEMVILFVTLAVLRFFY